VFAVREKEPRYADFAPEVADRSTLRARVEEDDGVARRKKKILRTFDEWWAEHSPRIARLPRSRDLNRVRAEMLDTFVEALLPGKALDRFDLAGVIASWWNETLPDFKTLIENGFPGVIDGWLDAISDALEEDDQSGSAFDPFAHKLVRRVMTDYLEQIAQARADVARFKAEKEEFEQSNPPEGADEEELKSWNYPQDLARQIKELKAEHRDDLKELAKRERAGEKNSATETDKRALAEWQVRVKPMLDEMGRLKEALAPYEKIKEQLAEAKARYRTLVNAFIEELRKRCAGKTEDEKQALVMDLLAEDLRAALDAVFVSLQKHLAGKVTNLWDKYRVTMQDLRAERDVAEERLKKALGGLGYAR
jgi:type I restriction enzyme M protein